VDLKREVDLIEEVERLYGVEKIPSHAAARRDWLRMRLIRLRSNRRSAPDFDRPRLERSAGTNADREVRMSEVRNEEIVALRIR
jgi:hypothetical protein